jgi:hypothetical protein
MEPHVLLTVDLTAHQALALAQLCKRVGLAELEANAVDRAEAYVMLDVVNALARELARLGFAPR